MRNRVEPDGHPRSREGRNLARTELVAVVRRLRFKASLTGRIFFAGCRNRLRFCTRNLEGPRHVLRPVEPDPCLEGFPPVGTKVVQTSSGEEETRWRINSTQHGKHVSEVGGIVVVERECKARASRGMAGGQFLDRDNVTHREQDLDVAAELFDSHAWNYFMRLHRVRADAVIDQGQRHPPLCSEATTDRAQRLPTEYRRCTFAPRPERSTRYTFAAPRRPRDP
jgi:hypothetical protein